jgi:hypothetical protein
MFSCVTLDSRDGETEEWHRYDLNVDCKSSEYQSFRVMAIIMFGVYPVGVPVFAIWVFSRNWARLFGFDSAPVARHVLSTPWWYGDRRTFNFMVRDYKPRVFYFEIVLPLPADSDLQLLFMV